MAEQSEEERIELRLAELKRQIAEHEQILTELWLLMLDLRVKRAAVRKLTEEENGSDE